MIVRRYVPNLNSSTRSDSGLAAVELGERLAVTTLPGAISALNQLNGAHTRSAIFTGFCFRPCCSYSADG